MTLSATLAYGVYLGNKWDIDTDALLARLPEGHEFRDLDPDEVGYPVGVEELILEIINLAGVKLVGIEYQYDFDYGGFVLVYKPSVVIGYDDPVSVSPEVLSSSQLVASLALLDALNALGLKGEPGWLLFALYG